MKKNDFNVEDAIADFKNKNKKELSKKDNSKPADSSENDTKSTIQTLLQKQVNYEFENERLYLSMSFWLSYNGFTETAKFFSNHATEERGHGMDFVNHMLSRKMKPELLSESILSTEFKDLKDVLLQAKEREELATKMIRDIHTEALKTSDLALIITNKYLIEQFEEEQLFNSLLDLYELCKQNPIDFEIKVMKLKHKPEIL